MQVGGVLTEIGLNQVCRKAVDAGVNRRVRCEEVSGAGRKKRHIERLPCFLHEEARPLPYGKSRVPFVQMANVRPYPKRMEHAVAHDAKNELLLQAHFRAAAIEFTGHAAIGRRIRWIVAVKQEKSYSSHSG